MPSFNASVTVADPVVAVLGLQRHGVDDSTPKPRWTERMLSWWKPHTAQGESAVHFHLDEPVVGKATPGYLLPLRGWVSASSPIEAVEVRHGPHPLQRFAQLQARPELAPHSGSGGGSRFVFSGEVSTLGYVGETEFTLEAVLANRRRVPLGLLRVSCPALRLTTPMPGLRPNVVVAFGRSGTTLLMSLLREHPDLLVAGGHPFEVQPLMHGLDLLRFLSQPSPVGADVSRHLPWQDRDPRLQGSLAGSGLDVWLRREQIEEHARNLVTCTEAFYRATASTLSRPAAQSFVEKAGVKQVIPLVEQLYPSARMIFLVRDFRDVICSVAAFNAQRGYRSFGRDKVESDEAFIDFRAALARWHHHLWLKYQHRAVLVRYEDLIQDQASSLRQLLEYLAVDSSDAMLDRIGTQARSQTDAFPSHRTTASPEQSVGRWRKDLSSAHRRLIESRIGDVLEAFGYLSSRDAEVAA